jgi:thiol-disulfide isomerase/thioredoxin
MSSLLLPDSASSHLLRLFSSRSVYSVLSSTLLSPESPPKKERKGKETKLKLQRYCTEYCIVCKSVLLVLVCFVIIPVPAWSRARPKSRQNIWKSAIFSSSALLVSRPPVFMSALSLSRRFLTASPSRTIRTTGTIPSFGFSFGFSAQRIHPRFTPVPPTTLRSYSSMADSSAPSTAMDAPAVVHNIQRSISMLWHSSIQADGSNSAQDFEKYVTDATGRLIVVDAFAEWCGPCKMIAPQMVKYVRPAFILLCLVQ